MSVVHNAYELTPQEQLALPKFTEISEPQMVALVSTGRAGTKFLQSLLDGHENILMIPGYPLMYLYPHWNDWLRGNSDEISWEQIIDLFCEKHASVLDSRKVAGLSGLERLGTDGDQHVEVNEQEFRSNLVALLNGMPICRRTFLLAVHYAYALCKGWDLKSKPVLLFHLHYVPYLQELTKDFPGIKVLHMLRNPRASLHSTARGLAIVDQAKLNLSDSIIYRGRVVRLSNKLHFESLDYMASYMDMGSIVSFTHEKLHQNLEQTMVRISNWLGVEFSDSMLQSTFDGKLWWGDVATRTAVNGLDPSAISDEWKRSLNKIDLFVVEGISYHLVSEYGYEKSAYQSDTPRNRLLLFFAILLPSKAEWKTTGFYLNPRTHARFLQAAFQEGTGQVQLKDYTWNATYLYKWTYLDVKLWRPRWHQRIVRFAENLRRSAGRGLVASGVSVLSCATYVTTQYVRLWIAIVTFPLQIFMRWNIQYRSLCRRFAGKSFLPKLIESP